MLTAQEIATAKAGFRYSQPADVFHEHDDCIRLAYEWLDAQKTIATSNGKFRPLKHIIEKWAGRYVSQSDVEVAAAMHPRIRGKYPDFNLSARLVLPSDKRLEGIGEALTQDYRDRLILDVYSTREDDLEG
ncbi:MAG TPA: hypothetical protein VM662_14045 [Sphingomonas sp.]|nr:hypothetical protein [Sphingomonas sp.]